MNGKELLEAMSFIDEELLAEAEAPRRRIAWRSWGTLAACLSIIVLGTISFRLLSGGPTEGLADQAAPEAALAAGAMQDSITASQEHAEEEPPEAGTPELADEAGAEVLPATQVRIIEVTEDGFIALVLTEARELQGLTVTLIPEEGMDISGVEAGKEYTVWATASEEDGILRIWDIQPADQED